MAKGKGKGKGRFMGLFNTAAVRPIVFLPQTSSRIHLQRRHASHRCARPLPAKAGTITINFASKSVIHERTNFFYMPQSWDMGHILFTSPPKEGILRIFLTPGKFNGFGRL